MYLHKFPNKKYKHDLPTSIIREAIALFQICRIDLSLFKT